MLPFRSETRRLTTIAVTSESRMKKSRCSIRSEKCNHKSGISEAIASSDERRSMSFFDFLPPAESPLAKR